VPDLTRRVHRLPALVTPAHCCRDDEAEELTGVDDARGLLGLVGLKTSGWPPEEGDVADERSE